MINSFIYVFCEDARDQLLNMQYMLLKQDEANRLYVFTNESRLDFERANISYILSDTLTF